MIYTFFLFCVYFNFHFGFFTTPWSVSTQVDSIFANFLEQKKTFYMRKEFNSHRNCLEHDHGRGFIVLEHQYGRRDVMCKRSIIFQISKSICQLMSLSFYFGENDTNKKRVNKAGILEISRLRLAFSLLWILLWLFLAVFVDFFFPILCVNIPLCSVLCYFCLKKRHKKTFVFLCIL